MRITFVLNQLGQCGGVINCLQIGKELTKKGHEVYVRYPYAPATTSYVKARRLAARTLRSVGILGQKEVDWMDASGLDIKVVPSLNERHIPDADAVIFSWWENAYDVKDYSSRKGEKFCYAQHYESLWGGPKEKVDATYRMCFHNLANSRWTEERILSTGAPVEGIVYCGVNEKFYPEPDHRPSQGEIVIGTPYREQEWKGYKDALRAFDMVKEKYPNAFLMSYGVVPPEAGFFSYFHKLNDDELRQWYNSCNVFVYASWYDGFALPPMEAMRCKVPTCSTQVGVLDDFHDYCGAFLSPPRDPEALANNIMLVMEDYRKTALKVGEAHEFACQFTWEKAAKSMLAALEDWVKR